MIGKQNFEKNVACVRVFFQYLVSEFEGKEQFKPVFFPYVVRFSDKNSKSPHSCS